GGGQATFAEFNDNFLENASKLERHLVHIVFDHRCAGVHPHVHCFIERKANGNSALDLTLGDFAAIHGKRSGPAFAVTGTLVLEIELERVLARCQFLLRGNTVFVLLLIGERVVKFRLPIQQEEPPSSESSPLRDEYTIATGLRNLYIRGDGE